MQKPCLAIATALAATLIVASRPAFAGSICGTVRDATNNQPVPQAALFLFNNSDQYTGLYEDTDFAGQYCIDDVPVGTYTLQVRVNNYLVAIVPGIEVTETPTGVDVDIPPSFSLREPWPNPASTAVTFRLYATPQAPVELDVFDVTGRRLYGWKGLSSSSGEHTIEWNLRDFNGSELESGIYFVRLRAAGQTAVRRFVRLR
jgi:hypothetical protein